MSSVRTTISVAVQDTTRCRNRGYQYSPNLTCPVSDACARASFSPLSPCPHTWYQQTSIRQPKKCPSTRTNKKNTTHLALQIERGSVRKRAFSPQLRRKRTQRAKHALALSADRRNDAHAELLWRVGLRSEHRGVVVDAGIDEQRAALARAVAGAKRVDPAGLDVDARYLGSVMSCEYGELDGAAPGVRREDGADVFVARAPFEKKEATTRNTPENENVRGLRQKKMRSYPKMASLQDSESIRMVSATTARQ